MKDHSFRLFGRNIYAARVYNHDYDDNYCDYQSINSSSNSKQGENRSEYEKTSKEEQRNRSHSTVTEDTKIVSSGDETSSTKSTDEKDKKILKKLDKILPCPRCSSMITKFCYFNNYNVNQPRHFCKDCQRYWTAGGTMRSVPVGSGKRKNKNKNLMFSENEVNFKRPYIWNPVAWQPRFPMPFYLSTPSSSLDCPSSRKHSRDGTMLFLEKFDSDVVDGTNDEENSGRVVKPKTMKFVDPIEAANSSVRTTLTVKDNRHVGNNPMTKPRFFGVPQQLYNGNEADEEMSNNPAACSRSLLFQEFA